MDDKTNVTYAGHYYSIDNLDVVNADGNSAGLRRQSIEVFKYLSNHSDRVVTRQELENAVWGKVAVTDDSLTKCISEIRKVLGDSSRTILKTLPKRGYQLIADSAEMSEATSNSNSSSVISTPETTPKNKSQIYSLLSWALLLIPLIGAFAFYQFQQKRQQTPTVTAVDAVENAGDGIPELAVVALSNDSQADTDANSLIPELRVALNRYRTIKLSSKSDTDMELRIRENENKSSVIAELVLQNSEDILFAESYTLEENSNPESGISLAQRIAAAVASPGVGAIDSYLLESTKLIPPEKMTKAACYAHGYGCSKCSGEEDNITRRAEACLAALIEKDPNDARAWALQATINAHQYWWANTLPEPLRSDPSLRKHLPAKAIEAANRAEALSDGRDTAVYWGMSEAYYSACESDKLKSSIDRGLEINPSDPNLLGAFGNWLAYSGHWDQGVALTMKALEIEPTRYRKWWWMGPAKAAYSREDFEQAYQFFIKAFNERNWVSHLQLAYTLPHLGRVEEARKTVATLQYIYPGFTREKALEIYQLLCFSDDFLTNMDKALRMAGLPSRGSSDDLANITLPRAKVVNAGGVDIEYLDVGKGEPIVFVHGAFNDYRSWGHYMVPVSESHRYISYSRRYYGTQYWKDEGEYFSIEIFAKDLINFIESLELESVHLVTWSSGARAATAAAVLRPELIKSIVHFEPVDNSVMAGMSDFETIEKLKNEWFAGFKPVIDHIKNGDEEGATRLLFEHVYELNDDGYSNEREQFKEVIRQNAKTLPLLFSRKKQKIELTCDYVSRANTPTLIVHGDETHGYWKRMALRFAECSPDATLVSMEGTNHYAPIERIEDFSKLVVDFVNDNQ